MKNAALVLFVAMSCASCSSKSGEARPQDDGTSAAYTGAGELRRICPGAAVTTRFFPTPDGQAAGSWLAETPFEIVRRSDDGEWILAKRSFDAFQAWVPSKNVCHLDARRSICGADSTDLFWADSAAERSGRSISRGEMVEVLELATTGFAKIAWKGERFWMWDDYLCPVDPNVAPPAPASKNLDVPYLCQVDNSKEPYSTCNNTSLAMITGFYGHPFDPDTLYNVLGAAATSLEKIQAVGKSVGFAVDIRRDANESIVKQHIAAGRPVILGGYFTGGSGHFIVIRGYNETGWFVNDPAGRWNGVVSGGYNGRWCGGGGGGANLHYTYEQVRAAAGSGWWIAVPHL